MLRECYLYYVCIAYFFLVFPAAYFYGSHCGVLGYMRIIDSYFFVIKHGLIAMKCSHWSLFMLLGLSSTLSDSKIMTLVFSLICNCPGHLGPVFYFKHMRTFFLDAFLVYSILRDFLC